MILQFSHGTRDPVTIIKMNSGVAPMGDFAFHFISIIGASFPFSKSGYEGCNCRKQCISGSRIVEEVCPQTLWGKEPSEESVERTRCPQS